MTDRLLLNLLLVVSCSSYAHGQTVTTMTYNIRHGLTTTNQSNLSRVADLIKKSKVDLVAIQEIDSATVRSLGRNQVRHLAQATGLKAAYGRAVTERQGSHGLAILSRYPIIATQVVQLPTSGEGARRVLLCAYVELPPKGNTLRFCTAKLDPHSVANRTAQAGTITALLKSSIQPVVWAVDLHSHTDDPLIRQMARYWRYAGINTEQITFPDLVSRFDYLLTRPNGELTQSNYRVLEENRTSDHYPVIATFRLR